MVLAGLDLSLCRAASRVPLRQGCSSRAKAA